MTTSDSPRNRLLLSVTIAAAGWLTGCSGSPSELPEKAIVTNQEASNPLAALVESEELILQLTPVAAKIAASMRNLSVPDDRSTGVFSNEVLFQWKDRKIPSDMVSDSSLGGLLENERPPGTVEKALVDGISYFEHAKVYFVSGSFRDPSTRHVFDSQMALEALARTDAPERKWLAMKGTMNVTWERMPKSGDLASWKISKWIQTSLKHTSASALMFEETLDHAIPDNATLERARESIHEQNIIQLFTENRYHVGKQIQANYQDLDSTFQHPAISVVDIDRDGFDDLYVMARWGRNQLLHNQGDGTFEDIAPAIGLDIDGFCNAALFADFDNDGDTDVFLGRSLERSMFLRNHDGNFVDESAIILPFPLPPLVSTIAAADYNNDGLLDVYLGLYGPSTPADRAEKWGKDFFPGQEAMQKELVDRQMNEHRYLDRFGPPNMLLKNSGGGKFSVGAEAAAVAEWYNTQQAAWADYDNDGDQDLYVCNDFAPDHFFRNDGPANKQKGTGPTIFTEISHEVAGNAMIGFGMGASWGDYNRDGHLDLYVSTMFSKAGRRITGQIDGLDSRIPFSAQGSLLFENRDGRTFLQVAGTEPPSMQVAKVGWAYGGQLIDVDNDGWLDVFAASGYYTAPAEIADSGDL